MCFSALSHRTSAENDDNIHFLQFPSGKVQKNTLGFHRETAENRYCSHFLHLSDGKVQKNLLRILNFVAKGVKKVKPERELFKFSDSSMYQKKSLSPKVAKKF